MSARMILVDANIFLRLAQPLEPASRVADEALRKLSRDGAILCIVPQSIYEFWVVATRPTSARGGFDWTLAQTEVEVRKLEQTYTLLTTSEADTYREWRRLVSIHNVSGVAAHDARLVAAMKLHGIEEILTFNTKDFARYATENIRVLDPSQIVAATS